MDLFAFFSLDKGIFHLYSPASGAKWIIVEGLSCPYFVDDTITVLMKKEG